MPYVNYNSLCEKIALKKHIIWDWNGTLVDDVDLCVEILNCLIDYYYSNFSKGRPSHVPVVNRDMYLKNFRFPIIEFYRSMGLDMNEDQFSKLSDIFVSTYRDKFSEVAVRNEHLQLIKNSRLQKKHVILSATHEDVLSYQVNYKGIVDFFDGICGIKDNLAGSKVSRAEDLMRDMKWSRSECLMVGDTHHDAEVADHIGIDYFIVPGGHTHPDKYQSMYDLSSIN